MLSNSSKVLMAHISFTAVINNGGIGKGISGIRKSTKKKQFSKRFDWNNIFAAILTNGGIGKGIKKNDIYDM